MKGRSGVSMESLLGLLRIRIYRGVNLAIRDVLSSDPYVIVRMGKQKLKTSVVKRNVNPEWNEDLTLSISDPNLPITLQVYDKDRFSFDDKMGDAEFDIVTFVEAVRMHFQNIPSGTIITKIKPSRVNCLAEESSIVWEDGKVVQNMVLRLRNVECGELELQLQWIDIPGSRGL
ncbi:PREDICTED: protein C2-DOMAIN ABA-RELATED 4-like [Ipomoea nil]|uniref:protein C2-DOMAIN ABA-RELATED 4-like n=1 Tax=Ipomoea nil TaxID=35883 RepID=UPI000900E05A|nr:PREDICTED: protein C2-DOMAIN ABA-RELATED 4-like [Ipomoea nil]XP_019182459.1 PREDICTED: protein C2-DOMAIN ABA-RELATED 4-like [Ipomoea nil]